MADELSDVTHGWVVGLIEGLANFCARWRTQARKKRLLRKALGNPAYEWRSIEALQLAIREDAETTRALLIDIGARPSESKKKVWKLK